MTTVHELIVQDAAVLVAVSEIDGLFYARVLAMPTVEAWGKTREEVLAKVAKRVQYAVDAA